MSSSVSSTKFLLQIIQKVSKNLLNQSNLHNKTLQSAEKNYQNVVVSFFNKVLVAKIAEKIKKKSKKSKKNRWIESNLHVKTLRSADSVSPTKFSVETAPNLNGNYHVGPRHWINNGVCVHCIRHWSKQHPNFRINLLKSGGP